MRKTKIMAGTTRTTKAVYVNGIQLDQVEEYVYLGQRFTLIEKNKDNEIRRRIKSRMTDIGKTQHNYDGYTTNMLKKKGLQPVYPSSNDIWSRYLNINNKMEKKLSAAQHNMERKNA